MADKNELYPVSCRVVSGVSKKTGKPWKGLEICFPSTDGGEPVKFMLFPRSLEWRLLGVRWE